MPKYIDPIDIKKAVRNNCLEFYIEGNFIYCRTLPINGECFIVGNTTNKSVVLKENKMKLNKDEIMKEANRKSVEYKNSLPNYYYFSNDEDESCYCDDNGKVTVLRGAMGLPNGNWIPLSSLV